MASGMKGGEAVVIKGVVCHEAKAWRKSENVAAWRRHEENNGIKQHGVAMAKGKITKKKKRREKKAWRA